MFPLRLKCVRLGHPDKLSRPADIVLSLNSNWNVTSHIIIIQNIFTINSIQDCNMNAFFSFNLFMDYIPELWNNTYRYEILQTLNLGCSFITLKTQRADFLKFIGPNGQKITRTGNTAKYANPGVGPNFLFQYFVLHHKSEMQLVCRSDHGQLGIRFCFKWHLLLKHATVSMVIILIIVFYQSHVSCLILKTM